MATAKIRHFESAPEVPLSENAVLIRGNLRERRETLDHHNPKVLDVTARALEAMQTEARGRVASVRADRTLRYRSFQFSGERSLPIEDLVATGQEGELGRRAALAGLRVIAEALGFALTPIQAPPSDLRVAMGEVLEQLGPAVGVGAAAMKDGHVDASEADDFDAMVREIERRVAVWKATRAEQAARGEVH